MATSEPTSGEHLLATIGTVLNSLDALVYVSDMETYEMIFMNQYGVENWGEYRGKRCYQVLQSGQNSQCSFCTNNKLVDADGRATGVLVWEFQNTVNGRWYQCRDEAIRWLDGRLVRIEIATDITDRKRAEARLDEAREKAEFLANTDDLTQLPNRRAFFEFGRKALQQAERYKRPLSVALLDVDHFKKINDRYGHAVGDELLRLISKELAAAIRESDICGRIGGDEFGLVLPETPVSEATTVCERVQNAIAGVQSETENGDRISVACSIGVIAYSGEPNFDALINGADKALYDAKGRGRDCIVVAQCPELS